MNSVKLFFEEGRTTIVIDNPTLEMNESLKKTFSENVSEITSLLAPPTEQVIPPSPSATTYSPTSVYEITNEMNESVNVSAEELLSDAEMQVRIGIDKTILILASELNMPMAKVQPWLDTATLDEKKERYLKLRHMFLNQHEH